MLYRVTVGEDVYMGRPEEVVAFMMRAEGAPPGDVLEYMQAVAARIGERLEVAGIDASCEVAFLDSLAERGLVLVEVFEEPSAERMDPREAVGEGPVAYGPGVDPRDVDV